MAHLAPLPGRVEHLAQIGDAGKHRRQRLEMEVGAMRQQPRDRGLAAAGRAPQDHRGQLPARHHPPDRAVRTQQMILADDLGEALRPQPVGERPRRLVLEQRAHRQAGGLVKGFGEGGAQGGVDIGHRRGDAEIGERGDPVLGDAAGDDAAVMVEVGIDVERHAVIGHPAPHPHPDRGDLGLAGADPRPRCRPGPRAARR